MEATPDDKVLAEQKAATIALMSDTIATLRGQVAALTHQVAQFQKLLFGSRHERFVPQEDNTSPQLTLALEAETVAQCKLTEAREVQYIRTKTEVTPNPPKAHPGRMKLPEHLRRETIVLQPDTDTSGLKKIGEEITEVLEWLPGELYVKQFIRPKYVSPLTAAETTVLTASLPGRVMEKCMAGEGLLAQIIVDKYMDHVPLHRQLQRFSRAGVTIAQSTINDWVRTVLVHLTALYEAHLRQVLACGYLQVDETGIKVLDEDKKGTTHQGWYWVYHSSIEKLVLFDYQPGRGREGPGAVLKDFRGYLQNDGYVAYEAFESREGITVLNCMAHARRKFVEALASDKASAEHALGLFQQLYGVERTIREGSLSAEEALEERREKAVPVLEELKQWMSTEYQKVLPKSPIGRAIAYCLPRWEKLSLYTRDAILNIDNNPVENAIRPVAVGRKNYLFCGSHDAAGRAAMVYSLFATCRLHAINPYEWLKDVLQTMHLYTTKNIHELLPQNWKKLEANMG
jgi:transposase